MPQCKGTVISTGKPCTNDAGGGNGEYCGHHCKCAVRVLGGLKRCNATFRLGSTLCQKHFEAERRSAEKAAAKAAATKTKARAVDGVARTSVEGVVCPQVDAKVLVPQGAQKNVPTKPNALTAPDIQTGKLKATSAKVKVYTSFEEASEIRSALRVGIRESSSSLRRRYQEKQPDACGYTGRSIAFSNLEVEHVVECQMGAFVLANCDDAELRSRMRAVNLGLPGEVKNSVLRPIFATHNADANLTFTDHALNMAKEGPIEKALRALQYGSAPERSLQNELAMTLERSPVDFLQAKSDIIAQNVVRKMRSAEDDYQAAMQLVSESDFPNVQGSRRKLIGMYHHLADDMSCLFETLHV